MECPALSGFTYQCCCCLQLATAKSSVSGSLTSSRTLPVQKTAAKSCSHPFLLPLMPTPSCSCSYKSSFFPFFPSHFLFHNPFTFPRNNHQIIPPAFPSVFLWEWNDKGVRHPFSISTGKNGVFRFQGSIAEKLVKSWCSVSKKWTLRYPSHHTVLAYLLNKLFTRAFLPQ